MKAGDWLMSAEHLARSGRGLLRARVVLFPGVSGFGLWRVMQPTFASVGAAFNGQA